ncbi:tyrosine-type recombinase/integrase [Polaromonas jejuensis]|uniref:Tyrosine-type recombinase/integrase n=1 Tax=Polaromonas jejuensis TaxID=457502 RepID=A0ABW0QCZ3_9BURK|nr:site-specific integrase [Polaromonas jejuensis]
MRLFLSDENLVVQGRAFKGFPLLVHKDGTAVEPAQSFLWDVLTANGRAQSPLTWAKYGRDIYDYFAFLDANGLDWQATPDRGMPSIVDWYRDWSKGEIGLDSVTINARLRLVARFYRWAQQMDLIRQLPFRYQVVRVSRTPGFLAHLDASSNMVALPRAMLSQKSALIKFLTMDQVLVCLGVLSNITHRLMFELMVRCGLRQIECRTFPVRYLCDPTKRRDLVPGQMIRLPLSERDMKLKYDKPRAIDVPYDLMEDLWWYAARHRKSRQQAAGAGATSSCLFLTQNGTPYGDTALTDIFADLERRVGFRVRPHMLRHTYGTYTLWKLRKVGFEGEPLLYVRDRMGHSSVSTTSIYLHLINQLGAQLVLQWEDEIDALFGRET